MNIQLLSGYNPYYNRQVKVHIEYSPWIVHEITNVNFNPNDGVRTEHICNYDDDYGAIDYLLYVEPDTGPTPTIYSRWFVIDAVRLRNGQCKFILKRDVMADYLYSVLSSKAIVHKGYINDYNDPSIYIKDGKYNQIKTAELPIRDNTRCPWVVGYIDRNFVETDIQASFPATAEATFEVSNISNWEHYNKEYRTDVNVTTHFTLNLQLSNRYAADYKAKATYIFTYEALRQKSEQQISEFGPGYIYRYGTSPNVGNLLRNIRGSNYYQNFIENYVEGLYPVTDFSVLTGIDGKIIKDTTTGIFYRINVDYSYGGNHFLIDPSLEIQGYLNSNLAQPQAAGASLSGSAAPDTWKLSVTTRSAKVNLEQIFDNINVSINPDRYHLEDAPYDMFCIPLADLEVRYGSVTDRFITNKEVAIPMATAISTQLGAACYDIQLLPYFPCQEILKDSDTALRVTRGKFQLITNSNRDPLSVLIWARKAEFSFINNTLSTPGRVPRVEYSMTKKVNHETVLYRICSPNYASAFDFSPAANNGVLEYQVSCTYRPYNPYIHVNPVFNDDGLYGGNYNDARGLICGGDFSLTQMSDAWVNYELNNKNFQRVFDRQIESLELQNKVGKVQDIVGATVGTVQGAATGAMLGAGGGGYGMAAGAILGGVGSLAGGIADISLNEQLRQDKLNLTRFNFEAQIDNIKAIPDTLTKVTALNPQNKIFPFIEVYEATDAEKDLCRDIIKWQGMSVEKIATISDYINYNDESFIKATLLRSDIRDNHIINAIADELSQGVYIVNGGMSI